MDECNAGDRRMIDVYDGGRAGPHPQSQIDWRSTTLYWMKKEFSHEILELIKIYFHKNS